MSFRLPGCLATTGAEPSRRENWMVWWWGVEMGLTGYSEHAGSLWKGHEGWRAARLSLSYVTGPSSRVSVDPLHVPLTSSTSSPPFLPPGPLLTQGGWCKVNLAGSLNLCFMKTPSSRTHICTHAGTDQLWCYSYFPST